MRLLHCIYDDPANPWVGGGGAVRVRELYRRLAGRVDVTVATGRWPGAEDDARDGVRWLRLGADGPYAWSRATYARAAARLLRDSAYDAAVLDFSVYAPVWLPRERPIGVTVHHLTGPHARARWGAAGGAALARLERALLRRGRRFSADSHDTARRLRALLPAAAPVDVVGAGVDDALFALPRGPAGYLLSLGRLDVRQKGIDTLLAAMALLAHRPDLPELRVAGRGRDAAAVRALARRLGVADRVRVLGPVSDAERAELLAGAELQVMPSRFEGFGLAAAEAMAAGVPLIASTAGSLPEVVGDGGLLVPPDDPPALAAAIARLLDDAPARAALGAAARRAARRFAWDAVAEAHLAWLGRIAGN